MGDQRWINVPPIVVKDGIKIYMWEGFDIRSTAKGNGVFSTMNHSPGLMLPYGGNEISLETCNKLLMEQPERISYVSIGKTNKQNNPVTFVDAHPTLYPKRSPKYAWIGSMLNEPSYGEKINCQLYFNCHVDDMPNYPKVKSKSFCYCMSTQ